MGTKVIVDPNHVKQKINKIISTFRKLYLLTSFNKVRQAPTATKWADSDELLFNKLGKVFLKTLKGSNWYKETKTSLVKLISGNPSTFKKGFIGSNNFVYS